MEMHWHIGNGITGYGPEPDSTSTSDDLFQTALIAADALKAEAGYLWEGAAPLAEFGDYEAAYKSIMHAESLRTTAANLDVERRRDAPLFQGEGGAAKFEQSIQHVLDAFPLDADHEGRRRVYVWTCTEEGCDSE